MFSRYFRVSANGKIFVAVIFLLFLRVYETDHDRIGTFGEIDVSGSFARGITGMKFYRGAMTFRLRPSLRRHLQLLEGHLAAAVTFVHM